MLLISYYKPYTTDMDSHTDTHTKVLRFPEILLIVMSGFHRSFCYICPGFTSKLSLGVTI